MGEEVSVGRDTSNWLSLNDRSVSRHHCLIRPDGGGFRIIDLESHNGTFVDGVPVSDHPLSHGSVIHVGETFFLFLTHEEVGPGPALGVQLDEGTLITRSTVRVRLEDVLYMVAHDLNILMKVCAKINSVTSVSALQQELLNSIFEVVPAERGAIILSDRSLDHNFSAFGISKPPGAPHPIQVSRTVAQQVLREGIALMSNDVVESDRLKSESLISLKVCSVLCVPLMLLDDVIGVIYLDATGATAGFNESHLQMVAAIAGLASGVLDRAQRMQLLEEENQRLKTASRIEHNMVGESPRMREVYAFIEKVSRSDTTVLIQGESGTGKELAAHAIHLNSPRADKPFVAVNCAALTETLIESELFGYEKGAFTGAVAQKKGKFEAAAGGTIFLDEVGEVSPTAQSKLLRVLQEKEFDRVGGARPVKLDVRIVAATNRDLADEVAAGRFRKDLYYRLNVVTLTMPSLRDRGEDITLLASYFTAKYAEKCKRRVTGLTAEARACMLRYGWPGNVRELENAVERAVVLGSTERIQPEDLPEAILETMTDDVHSAGYQDALREAKRQIVAGALTAAGGNHKDAARALRIHPNNLHRLIRNLGLKPQ